MRCASIRPNTHRQTTPMSDFDLAEWFLTSMIAYGAPAFGLALLLGAVGVPVPGTLFVLAAGAFARQGVLNWQQALGLGLAGVIVGDSISYAIGRVAGAPFIQRYAQNPAWQKADATFARRGGWAIYLTRWLLTPLALPVNLIAGSTAYAFWRYLGFVVIGEATWVVLYGTLGYATGSQWELLSQLVSDFSGFLVGGAVLALGIYLLVRRLRRNASK
jgi:membrane-associated protein